MKTKEYPLYYSEEMNREMLQLSDRRLLQEVEEYIECELDYHKYCAMIEYERIKLSKKYNTTIYFLGKSGRHICIENNTSNKRRFANIVNDVNKSMNEIVDIIKAHNNNTKND